MSATYTIGRMASAAGVHVETVRYYQRRGLIAEPERPVRGVRRYPDDCVQRLRFIKTAQSAGFSLTEIGGLLDLAQNHSCRATRAIVADKLQAIETRLDELGRLRAELQRWIGQCDANERDDQCPTLAAIGTP